MRTRLAVAASAAVAVVAICVCTASFFVLRYKLYQQLDQNLSQSATLAAQEHRAEEEQDFGVLAGECRFLGAPACAQVVPAAAADDPRQPYLLPVDRATRQVAAGELAPYYSNFTLPNGKPGRMLTTTYGKGSAFQVALRADIAERGVRQTAAILSVVGGAGVLLSALGGYWVSRTGLAPVARLTATAERIATTRDARHRIELPPGRRGGRTEDEVTRLATAFNTMLGELEESVAARRRLVADASHELRTPLTSLRTNAELLARADRLTAGQRDRASAALGRQLREVTGLVNDLIELARDEEPQPLLEEVRVAPLVEHVVNAARGHWPAIAFTLDTAPGAAALTLPGVPSRLSRLVTNLLDDAAKFSPEGSLVEVSLTSADLTVRDHGPGIAPEDLPHVFDRFYRAERARALPGSGLGLAMARQIAHAHGAELTAEHAPGGGARFRLTWRTPGDEPGSVGLRDKR
ncbi:sensor histidine kinase [Streptomyces aureocirculatus]|uniref:sensor histidine kinase n=1 Tax=Streptomyces aureocirculatus TaxID=67275 RepID=UPI00068C1430|nr:HAMP domain-containing sensor histidine kinase [Streptomyces aureocirculatus]